MTDAAFPTRSIDVLLVEQDPGDVRRLSETLRDDKVVCTPLAVVGDGVEALAYLRREAPYRHAPRPDLVLLNLSLPRKDGFEVLRELRADPVLRDIHVVLVCRSQEESEIARSLQADCYVTKPVTMEQIFTIVRSIEDFWLSIVRLPGHAPWPVEPDAPSRLQDPHRAE